GPGVRDAALAQVVGRNGDGDDVTGQDADEVLAHLPRDVADQLVPVVQLDAELRVRQRLHDLALHEIMFFFGHKGPFRERCVCSHNDTSTLQYAGEFDQRRIARRAADVSPPV